MVSQWFLDRKGQFCPVALSSPVSKQRPPRGSRVYIATDRIRTEPLAAWDRGYSREQSEALPGPHPRVGFACFLICSARAIHPELFDLPALVG